jgi:hypothetical protein
MGEGRPVVFLHIGAMKTGTTFLQHLMIANKESLAAAGYLFPGETWNRQVRAVQEVLGQTQDDPRVKAESAGAWGDLVDEMRSHTGVASVVSMEFLSFAGYREARRVVRSLDGADVHIVLTVRDAAGTIPAQWQTSVHNGATVGWPQFAAGARRASAPAGPLWGRFARDQGLRVFLRAQDVAHMLRLWGRLVPPDRLHVVTVPTSGSDPRLLWRRFAQVLGVDPAVCPEEPRQVNESLGYASSELLRRVNRELGPLRYTAYNQTVKHPLALRVLSRRAKKESKARIDRQTYEFALEWNRRTREAIKRSGAVLAGDLDDLPTTPRPELVSTSDEPQPAPTDEELLAAAQTAVQGMKKVIRRRRRRLRRWGHDPAVGKPPVDVDMDSWAESEDPVAEAVGDVTRLCRMAIDLKELMLAHRPGR